jgi:hypothetical protein
MWGYLVWGDGHCSNVCATVLEAERSRATVCKVCSISTLSTCTVCWFGMTFTTCDLLCRP